MRTPLDIHSNFLIYYDILLDDLHFTITGKRQRCFKTPCFEASMSYSQWAEAQLAEVELLTSMFPSQEELEITDQLALAEVRAFVEGSAGIPASSRPQFLIKQKLDAVSIDG